MFGHFRPERIKQVLQRLESAAGQKAISKPRRRMPLCPRASPTRLAIFHDFQAVASDRFARRADRFVLSEIMSSPSMKNIPLPFFGNV
jgi:hypothetical protein